VVLALAALVCLRGIGEQPFYTKGEPREAIVVWEMAHGGGVVLPLRNGTEIPSKPPFFHWLGLLASSSTGGVSELSVRLPSALLAIAAVVAVYAFGATVGPLRAGWLAGTALLLCFEWVRAARISRVDMTLTFFLFAALLLYGIIRRDGVTRFRLVLFYAAVTAATLGKGPVGIALPAAVILADAFFAPIAGHAGSRSRLGDLAPRLRNARTVVASLAPMRGLLFVLLVVGAWYVAAWIVGGNDFLVKHALKENVFRVVAPDVLDTGHRHGPLYLLPHGFLGALPWSLLAPGVAWFLWRSRPLDPTVRYLVVWFVTVIVFFSIPASKRPVYLLPAYPAGALLLGLVLGPGPEGSGPRRLVAWGLWVAAAVVGVVGLAALAIAAGAPVEALLGPSLTPRDLQGTTVALAALAAERWTTAFAGAAMVAGAALVAREAPGAHWLRANLALSAALVCGILLIALPVESAIARSRTLKPFFVQVREIVDDQPIAFYRAFDYGAVYYADRHIETWKGDLADPAASPPPFLLLWADEAARLAPHLRVLLESSGTNPKGRTHMVLATPRRSS
jgi:4-amino-4-deoxy-L-arabinose transferase-like glycosyltransferase